MFNTAVQLVRHSAALKSDRAALPTVSSLQAVTLDCLPNGIVQHAGCAPCVPP